MNSNAKPNGNGVAPVSPEFEAYYLQRATQELAEDLDKVRGADDFRNDAVPMLVRALKQGADMFTPAEQERIAGAGRTSSKAPTEPSSSK